VATQIGQLVHFSETQPYPTGLSSGRRNSVNTGAHGERGREADTLVRDQGTKLPEVETF